jgi:hypothetical protein
VSTKGTLIMDFSRLSISSLPYKKWQFDKVEHITLMTKSDTYYRKMTLITIKNVPSETKVKFIPNNGTITYNS